MDLNSDTDDSGAPIGQHRVGQLFQLGCDVVWGDDDWDSKRLFEYDPDSNIMVTMRKYGGARDGDVEYEGETVRSS